MGDNYNMKRNEIIELNGVEYTLELNRDSFLQIDKICNVQKSMEIIQKGLYEYVDEIDDNYNPLENTISDEDLEKEIKEIRYETNNCGSSFQNSSALIPYSKACGKR